MTPEQQKQLDKWISETDLHEKERAKARQREICTMARRILGMASSDGIMCLAIAASCTVSFERKEKGEIR